MTPNLPEAAKLAQQALAQVGAIRPGGSRELHGAARRGLAAALAASAEPTLTEAVKSALNDLHGAAVNAVFYVGSANYADRQDEAIQRVDTALTKAIAILDAALAASAEPTEPFGWFYESLGGAKVFHRERSASFDADMGAASDFSHGHKITPLYTSPPAQAEPVGRRCQGTNCTKRVNHDEPHSQECFAEHEATVNEAMRSDHIAHGGWKCHFCSFDGQDNAPYNRFCSSCRRSK
jgi:hypothetical protein